jgi:hypothetical protein
MTLERIPKSWKHSKRAWREAAEIIAKRQRHRQHRRFMREPVVPRPKVESEFLDAEGKDVVPKGMSDFPTPGVETVLPFLLAPKGVRWRDESDPIDFSFVQFSQRRFRVERVTWREVK